MFAGYCIVSLLVSLFILLYLWMQKKFTYWSRRGVPGPPPNLLFGNVLQRLWMQPIECEWTWAQRYGKLYGVYYGTKPVLTILEPELIRQVMIRDFNSVVNHRYFSTYHEIFNRNLFMLEGNDWKRVRSIITPSFTLSKLRAMQGLMESCIGQLNKYLEQIIEQKQNGKADIELRKIFSGLTIDIIAATAFATETNANDEKCETKFVSNGLQFLSIPPLHLIGLFLFPRFLNKLLNIQTPFPNDNYHFFQKLAEKIVKLRLGSTERRDDLVQLMIDAYAYESDLKNYDYEKLIASDLNDIKTTLDQNNMGKDLIVKYKLSEKEIVAQCILFFITGFGSTGYTLSLCVYELTMNPEAQQRLYEEIISVVGECKPGTEKYLDLVLRQMPYLEGVIKETLRKYPPIVRLERRVSAESYEIAGIKLPKDALIEVPTVGVHYDPELYPEPHAFWPERWLPENQHCLVPYTFLPFGIGPRNCIGIQFGYQVVKLTLVHLMATYVFEPNQDTPEKLQFACGKPILEIKQIPVTILRR